MCEEIEEEMFKHNEEDEDFNPSDSDNYDMGVALSVFRLINLTKNKLIKENLTSQTQMTFNDFDEVANSLGEAHSKMKYVRYDKEKNIVEYNVVHFSDTKKNPIRVFVDDVQEVLSDIPRKTITTEKGFQEIYNFPVKIDFEENEIYVFTTKRIAKQFMSRLKRANILEFEKIRLDLSKIQEVVEVSNVWCVWEDIVGGRCKKKAYYGSNVHKEDSVSGEHITSYNVDFEHEGGATVDLFIDMECKFASKSSLLDNENMMNIYKILKEGLLIKETSQQ